MKKIKKIFLVTFALSCFMVTSPVFADIGAPMTAEFKVRVTNPSGAIVNYTDYNENNKEKTFVIPYDSVVLVRDYSFSTRVNLQISNCSNYIGIYADCWLNASDITGINETVDFSLLAPLNIPKKIYVFRDGAVLRKGPSALFEEVSNGYIPVGTILNYTYSDNVYAFVEYNGISGWIFIGYLGTSDNVNVADYSTQTIYLAEETKMYGSPDSSSENEIISIPKDSILQSEYSFMTSPFTSSFYVTYNGHGGWVKESENQIAIQGNDDGVTTEETQIFTDINNSGEVIGVIPKFTKVSILFSRYTKMCFDGCSGRITYNGVSGWINLSDMLTKISRNAPPLTINEGAIIYDMPGGKQIGTVTETTSEFYPQLSSYVDEELRRWYLYPFMTSAGAVDGWVVFDDDGQSHSEEKAIAEKWKLIDEIEAKKYISVDTKDTTDAQADEDQRKKTITYCAAAAILIMIIIISIIVVVKEKKKKKNQPQDIIEASNNNAAQDTIIDGTQKGHNTSLVTDTNNDAEAIAAAQAQEADISTNDEEKNEKDNSKAEEIDLADALDASADEEIISKGEENEN